MSAGLAARDRFARLEPSIHAFVQVDDAAWAVLDRTDGALAGVAVGVKDIVDARGMPTRNGSATAAHAAPAAVDAPVVAALRAAGAAIVGKTTSTEFAFTDPTDTRHPRDPSRTPGGSSSGSGAAVGAGCVELAVATQTAGSLCRPAAYCGAVGFKPSFGRLSTAGVTPLSPSFDTVGFIARDVALAAAAFQVAIDADARDGRDWRIERGGRDERDERDERNGRIDRADTERAPTRAQQATGAWPAIAYAVVDPAAPMTADALLARARAADAIVADGGRVATVDARFDFDRIVADHRRVMLHEAASLHGHLLSTSATLLKPNFAAALGEGLGIDAADAAAALARLRAARDAFWDAMSAHDVLLACPVTGAAPPRSGGTTGYQHLLTPWTVFGGPLLCVPWGVDADGMPLSVMLASAPGTDATLLATGRALEALAA